MINIENILFEDFRKYAEDLKNNRGFDFLKCVTGVDNGEGILGVIYSFYSTSRNEELHIKVNAQQFEYESSQEYFLPSISDLWRSAELNEREVFDFYGIRFFNNPDMRRLFLREDWVGYPFRKDFSMDREKNQNPIRMENECPKDDTEMFSLENGKVVKTTRPIFTPEQFVVNVGPQHPATHGVLRFRTALEGEMIQKIDVHCGYIHRGIEKLSEGLDYRQSLAFVDRLDYLAAHQNRHAFCMAIEKALELEIPERVQYIRTICDELQRIDSHLLFFAALCMDLGALTAFFYGFREREKILDIFDDTCGGRLIMNYYVIGGLQNDITPNFVPKVKEFIPYMREKIKEYHKLFTGNIIAQNRLKGVGILTKEEAINFGATGATGRASGWACDVRKLTPYAAYDKVDFKEIIYTEGDSFARYMVRMEEILESLKIIEQLIDNIPEGEYQVKTKPIIKLPEGYFWQSVEASRGEFGVFIESRGDRTPYRLKYRSTGLPLVSVVDHLTENAKVADLIAIGGTLDYVVPDIDR